MIKILYNNKEYLIDKKKLKFILEKLDNSKVCDAEIYKLMEKYCLYDEYFLENMCNL